MVGLSSLGLSITLGKSPPPVRVLSVPWETVNGLPVDAVKIVDSCQFPRIFCSVDDENLGVLPTNEVLKACVRSDKQAPYSLCLSFGIWGEPPPLRATSFSVKQ